MSEWFSLTPQFSLGFTPSGTPKILSTGGSPRSYSATTSPKLFSGAASPTSSHYDILPVFFFKPANSPLRSHSTSVRHPRVDGKEFFRQARSRLSYQQFSAFLANIKELNAKKQSGEAKLFLINRWMDLYGFWGGNSRTRGTCHIETFLEIGTTSLVSSETWEQIKIFRDVLSHYSNNRSESVKMNVLNITAMAGQRKDGVALLSRFT